MSLDFKLLFLHTVDNLKTWSNFFASKRVLARLLSTFLCCIVVVIRPFSVLGGSSAFLVLALKELVFSVQDSLAQQLELTVLNILGALAGIGISTLAKFIASRYPEDSSRSRATCAIFLVLISFIGESVQLMYSLTLNVNFGFCSRSCKEPSSSFEFVYPDILLRLHMDLNY